MEPFIGEITIAGFGFAPTGWALCNGAVMLVQQNQALYSLLGQAFGGDGSTKFQLPNLCGRTPVGSYAPTSTPSNGLTKYGLGNSYGSETVALTTSQIPAHTHNVYATTATATKGIANSIPGAVVDQTSGAAVNAFAAPAGSLVALVNQVSTAGAGGAHNNLQPFSVLNFIIATSGVYPSRS